MLAYNLPVSIALLAFALASFLLFVSRWSQDQSSEGKIQLPLTHDDQEPLESPEADPFDVVRPRDLVDGYPVGLDSFLNKVPSFCRSAVANQYLNIS